MALEQRFQPAAAADRADLQARHLPILAEAPGEHGQGRDRGRLPLALIGPLLVVSAVYAVSRLYMLLALPIFFDEAHYTLSALLIGRDPLHTNPFIEVEYWGVPPLFTWVAAPLTRLVSEPLLAGRLASVGIGAMGLIGVWKCGRTVGGLSAALLSVVFYVLCPFMLLYNRMAMVDGLLAVIGSFALLAAMRLARAPGVGPALVLGSCCAAAIFTKIFGPLDLALAGAAIAAAPARARRQMVRLASFAALIGLVAFLALLIAPGSQSLILVAAQQQGGSATLITRSISQLAIIGQSYWLYVTPPVLALALAGAFASRHGPENRVLLLWAVLSWLPFVVVHLSPRYLLTGVIPIVVLAARGTVELAKASGRHHVPTSVPVRPVVAGALLILAAGACVWEDVPLIISPASATLVAVDRAQYITEWPAGYALARALADLRRLTHGQAVTLISSVQNPPADALAVLVGNDPHIQLLYRDFSGLQRPAALESYPEHTFIVECRPFGQQIDSRRAGLHLVIAEPNFGGAGGVYVYTTYRHGA